MTRTRPVTPTAASAAAPIQGVPVGPGVWESSGIITADAMFGRDTWISDVQAHPPTTAPGGPTVTVEDGQLFLMRRAE
jgi:hypothetical protein